MRKNSKVIENPSVAIEKQRIENMNYLLHAMISEQRNVAPEDRAKSLSELLKKISGNSYRLTANPADYNLRPNPVFPIQRSRLSGISVPLNFWNTLSSDRVLTSVIPPDFFDRGGGFRLSLDDVLKKVEYNWEIVAFILYACNIPDDKFTVTRHLRFNMAYQPRFIVTEVGSYDKLVSIAFGSKPIHWEIDRNGFEQPIYYLIRKKNTGKSAELFEHETLEVYEVRNIGDTRFYKPALIRSARESAVIKSFSYRF